ncbi:MAG TPA: FKBP-type peptidyl-prolyl cis-trans isomerase [Candidatus Acidoferrales bacterium]|nr:FKBP-type peptidyl-prolyl cis-trans isomerase [Candidatus Acidoferrales bacterium]
MIRTAARIFVVGSVLGGGILGGSVLARQDSTQSQQSSVAKSQQAAPAKAQKASAAKVPQGASSKVAQGSATKSGNAMLQTKKDRASYALGMNFGSGLKAQSSELDSAMVLRGLKDVLAGKTLLTQDQERAALAELQADMQKQTEAKMQQLGEANQKEGESFLAANKTKAGVVTLASGLQYKILKEGTGPKPSASDTVVCNYRGTLVNGKEFDSSYRHGQPASFPVGGVIRGWTEALQLMPVGSKWELFLPSDLAYGQRGAGPDIGPNATLIFEVELLSIQGKGGR